MIRNFRLAMCVFVVSVLAGGTAVKAQQTLGGINGTVRDTSGGVISHATVKVRNVETNLKQTTNTHENGEFSFVDLPIGTYEVTITNGGFKTEDAERALFEFLHLLAARVGRVIGGDGVDGARDDTFGNGCDVARRTQRRLHFVIAVIGRHLTVAESEMVRGGFTGDGKAARFCEGDHFNGVA